MNAEKAKKVIESFVTHLRNLGYPCSNVERWPDEENRDSKDIDAITGKFAIEHTSIDAIPNQRRDSAWFLRVVGGLESEITCPLPFRLGITLKNDAIGTEQDWNSIRAALKRWISNDAGFLPEGLSRFESLPGIPFPLVVNKSGRHCPGVVFGRFAPNDSTLSERVKTAIENKSGKLVINVNYFSRPATIKIPVSCLFQREGG